MIDEKVKVLINIPAGLRDRLKILAVKKQQKFQEVYTSALEDWSVAEELRLEQENDIED
jgi:hypothetical protein